MTSAVAADLAECPRGTWIKRVAQDWRRGSYALYSKHLAISNCCNPQDGWIKLLTSDQ